MTQEVELAYQRALDYIYRFADYDQGPYHYSPPIHNLERTARLLAGLGQPQQRYPSLLIAGTKGKGSTAAFLERILRAAGRRTGLYTSPHLHSWRERVQVNRQLIPKAEVAQWVQRLRPLVEQIQEQGDVGPPTYYEISTALALAYFAAQEVDVAVLEVGLGGRLDSTNVVTPAISILTTIGYDHMAILGNTLDKIAGEKAAIVKPAGWAVSASQQQQAMAVIEATCRERQARLWIAAEEGIQQALPEAAGPWPYPVPLDPDQLALRGPFQQLNARVALATVQVLREQGWDIPPAAIREGLYTTLWPLRLELAGECPWIVLDAAHNIDSARALRQALQVEFSFDRLILVTGLSRGHDIAAFVAEVGIEAAHILVTSSHHPRSADAADQAEAIRSRVMVPVEAIDEVPEALARARQLATAGDMICICGLFVAAEAREALGLAQEVDCAHFDLQ